MLQTDNLREKLGTAWCVLMHDAPMWPIHGQYRCRDCGREFPALAGSESIAGARTVSRAMVSVRSVSMFALAFVLLGATAGHAEEMAAATTTLTASRPSDFALGRSYFADGQFEKAAAHFERAAASDPGSAESAYWLGRSYSVLADLAGPLDGRRRSKARLNLTRAVELAPDRAEYRRELFDFLLDGSGSRSSIRQAAGLLGAMPESDPDYPYLRDRLTAETKESRGAGHLVGAGLLAAPRAFYRPADTAVAWIK